MALVAASVLLLTGGAAAGHANYVKSNPASDARLTKPPTEVRVTFSETPDARGSDVAVLDVGGNRLDKHDVTLVSDEANTLRVTLGAIGDGGYLVSWTTLSAVDGHETKGAFAFAVNAPLPAIKDIGPSAPPPTPVEIGGRALSYAGMALLTGLAFFTLFIRAPVADAEARRERRLVIVGGAALVAGSAFLVLNQGANIPARLLLLLGLRALAGVAALASLAVPTRVLPDDARREGTAFLGLAAGLTVTLVSHAAARGDLRYVALDYLHVIAISIWLGGVVAFSYVAMPSARTDDPRGLGRTIWRFSLTALVAVAAIITTGTLQSLDRLVLVEDLVETPYGIALLAKIVLLVGVLGLGALNLLVWGPRMRRGHAASAQFWRGVIGETTLFAGVLVAAAFLTAFAPPAQANGAAFDETKHVSGIRIELLTTTLPGRNRFIVRVQQGLVPIRGAEKVTLRFTMVEHDMGEQELVTTERAPGEYVAEGSPTAMLGTWKVETIVRLAGRADVHALFTVPVSQPPGQDATTKILAVPPYQLIVFSEPFQPQAGAPVTINVVVVDSKGDPAIGKKVRATFNGPSTVAPLDGVENVAELGPGRYRFTVPGLDAGSWKITLSVSDAGSGVYELVVSR